MRTKTLLLFVFLLTGMVFSQQGGGKERIDFSMITVILRMQHIESIKTYLEESGYKNTDGVNFQNKNHKFVITSVTDKGPFTYSESIDDKARYDDLLKDALEYGLVVKTKNSRGEYELKGRGFQVSISKGYFVMEKLK